MPPTGTETNKPQFVVGVDGCRGGWLAVRLYLTASEHEQRGKFEIEAKIFSHFDCLIASEWSKAGVIAVDIPIGLADFGRRGCDVLARKYLGRPRASSVFPAPRRGMLNAATYAEANAIGKAQGREGGGGLSRQAWNIMPKIKEVDICLSRKPLTHIVEGHPEVAFARLYDDCAIEQSKQTKCGKIMRRQILESSGLSDLDQIWSDTISVYSPASAGFDDFLDACALSLTARSIALGLPVQHLTEGKTDPHGIPFAIWG